MRVALACEGWESMTSLVNSAAEPGPVSGPGAPSGADPSGPPGVDSGAVPGGGAGPAAPDLTAPPWVGGGYPPYPVAKPGRFSAFLIRLQTRSPRWLGPAAILTCFAGAGAYVLAANPTDSTADAVPTCLVKLTTGFDCPGCGGTRAFWYVLHGNVPAAARHHLIFVFALPFLVYMYVAWASQRVFGRRLPPLRLSPWAIGVFLGAWFAFTIVRNLPWAPFTWFYV
jgi:hypothetical protein